jgi:hypothetical protein
MQYVIHAAAPDQWVKDAAKEAGCKPNDIVTRLKALYEANLYEDLKWILHDMQENPDPCGCEQNQHGETQYCEDHYAEIMKDGES